MKQIDSGSHMPQSSMENRRSMMAIEYPPYKRKREMNYNSSSEWHPKVPSADSFIPDSPASAKDECEIFGQYVASKLRKMDRSMQLLSERLISDVLFWGQMGELSRNTVIKEDHQIIKIEDSARNSH